MTGSSPNQTFHIVVAEPLDTFALDRLRQIGEVSLLQNSAPDTIIAAMPTADALLVRSKAHVTARIIDAAPNLKVIGRASPTVDHIDLNAAKRRQISIVYSPEAATNSAAEFALGLILMLNRRIPSLNYKLREGQFENLRKPERQAIGSQTIGLLGLDSVARKLATTLHAAFQPNIIYHDPQGDQLAGFDANAVDFDTLLTESDFLSLHLPLTKETRGILNIEALAKMKTSAILINISRGALIDTVALVKALKSHAIAFAALDVFETEPLPNSHPIRKAPNCILTPHVAGITSDASAGRFSVVEDIVRVLNGRPPQFPFFSKKP